MAVVANQTQRGGGVLTLWAARPAVPAGFAGLAATQFLSSTDTPTAW